MISTNNLTILLTTNQMESSSVLLDLYDILLKYISPVLVFNALIGNVIVVALTCTENAFSRQTSFTMRAYYMSFAVADIITVIVSNLVLWFGV